MMGYIVVFFGAGIGGALRPGANMLALRWLGAGFPFGTLFINILGSFVMGLLTALFLVKMGLPQHLRLFLTTGLVGGFTTFSTFSLEAALLFERGHLLQMALYVGGSVLFGIIGFFAAMWIVRSIAGGF